MAMQERDLSDGGGNGQLPLRGFARPYEAQLRSERKSARTIEAYNYALQRFARWFTAAYEREPLLADLSAAQARLFLADALERPKWSGHPFLERETSARISTVTLHQYGRSLKNLWRLAGS